MNYPFRVEIWAETVWRPLASRGRVRGRDKASWPAAIDLSLLQRIAGPEYDTANPSRSSPVELAIFGKCERSDIGASGSES